MDILIKEEFDQVISLGGLCFVKYQIALDQFRRQFGEPVDIRQFERALYGHNRETFPLGNDIFDWLVTPATALALVLSEGMPTLFDRAYLAVNNGGSVQDRRSGVVFQHAFTRHGASVRPETIQAEYDIQLAKHLYLEKKFLARCASSHRVLYVRADVKDCLKNLEETKYFAAMLRQFYPKHAFQVLHISLAAVPRGYLGSTDTVTAYELSNVNSKPAAAQWQGANEVWAPLLAGIRLSKCIH